MTQFLQDLHEQILDDFNHLKSKYKYSYLEAFLTSFTVGIAENFFAAFSIDQGMSTLQSGLLLSLPLILALFSNLIGHILFKNQNLTHQILRNVYLQAFALFGLCLSPFISYSNSNFMFTTLLLLYSIYWYGHFTSVPSWTKWISEIIDHDKGSDYFALRTRMTQIGILLGLVLGGFLLHSKFFTIPHQFLFVTLFGLGILAQILKINSLKKHQKSNSMIEFSFLKMKKIYSSNKNFFSTYGLFNISLYLSAPYVTGYLINERKIDYFQFMIVTAFLFLGKISMTYILSLKEKQFSPLKMMAWGGLVAAPLPLAWPFCHSFESMLLLNFTSGMSWALWDIGLSLTFFKKVSAEDKIETVSIYNFIGITTQVCGTLIGAFLVKYIYLLNYEKAFVVAGIVRFICVLPFQKNNNFFSKIQNENKKTNLDQAS